MTDARHVPHVVIVTDRADPSPGLRQAISDRAARGPAVFRVLMPDPARAELHVVHLDRHVQGAKALAELTAALPVYEAAAGGQVVATVSVRHDPFEAVEELTFREPVDEIIVAVVGHGLSTWLHHDAASRLAHLRRPVTRVESDVLLR
jgi:hypothetical protein